jgi:hypothetical protein
VTAAAQPSPLPNVWSEGQLLAFSALDGASDYARGLVGRTLSGGPGVRLVLPAECVLRFGQGPAARVELTGDLFALTIPSGRVRGALLDARHLLIEGPCEVRGCSAAIAVR